MEARIRRQMGPGYITVKTATDGDPEVPQPVPFPIRIVQDPVTPAPPPPAPSDPLLGLGLAKVKKTDHFYDAWDKFLALEPKRSKTTSAAAKKIQEVKESVEQSPQSEDGLRVNENAFTSWEQAAEECRRKVKAIVEECRRLNQKYRDALFDFETNNYCLQSLDGQFPKATDRIEAPPWIKRVEDIFDKPEFFIDGATATDVHQGSSGDCWFLAALMAVTAKKELIDRLCIERDEQVGVYGFVFYRDGEWIYEVIDDKLFMRVGDDDELDIVRGWKKDKKEGIAVKYDDEKLLDTLQKGGEALYFSHCKSNETWLPLIEKAYAKAHGDYHAIEGGFASEGIEDLTGGVASMINPEDIMDKERFWREQLSQVNEKYLFGGGSKTYAKKALVGSHAYAVMQAWEEGDLKLLKLRNPWGEVEWEGDWSDGSKLWTPEMMQKLNHTFGDDGVFWISYKDFLKHFPSINRVRIFDKNWQVAQQWTAVNPPWTPDYLDTKFQFTIDKKCSVVIVLQQPDERYFDGLKGRYFHALHFRVCKEGDEEGKYIVRSMLNSGGDFTCTRSVSAELDDLEAGTYNVLIKVTTTRDSKSCTPEDAIMKYATSRKEKLLHVGRRFDYAMSKGKLREMEQASKGRRRREKRETNIADAKKVRLYNKNERERAGKRKQRIKDAMREKKRDYEEKKRERERQKRWRIAERNGERARVFEAKFAAEDEKVDLRATITPATTDEPKQKEEVSKDAATNDPTAEQTDGGSKLAPEESTSREPEEKEPPLAEPTPDEPQTKHALLKEPSSSAPPANDSTSKEPASDIPVPDADADKEKKPAISRTSTRTDDSFEPNSLSNNFSKLTLRKTQSTSTDAQSLEEEDDEYESPLEEPEEMKDDDFDWDSDIDGPGHETSSSAEPTYHKHSAIGYRNEIFSDDPWDAICVLGLRVYSLEAVARLKVVRGEDST